MDNGIFILYRKLTDTKASFCCLCYKTVNEETASVQDFVVLSLNSNNDTKEFSKDEEVGIYYILQQILGSKVAACLSEYDQICETCILSAIDSYKFINMCRANAESMANSLEAFTSTIEHTEGIDLQNYETLFLFMDFQGSKCTQYYDTTKFTDSNAALYKFQTLFRPFRSIIDKKGNTKFKCTKCRNVFLNSMNAYKHFNTKHIKDQDHEQCLSEEIRKNLTDDDNDIYPDDNDSQSIAPNWNNRYSRDNVRGLNELSHEVIVDCDGVNKYRCKDCKSIYLCAESARRHYKKTHVPKSEIDTNMFYKRSRRVDDKTNIKKTKLEYLTEFNYCRDSVKHLNELSHTAFEDSDSTLKYKCRECTSVFSLPQAARRHYLKKHVEDIMFEEESVMREDEIKTKTKRKKIINDDKLTCIYCNENYENKYILIEHILKEHAKNSEICSDTNLEDIHLLGQDIYNYVYTKVRDENGCDKYCCKMCMNLFKKLQTVRVHFNNIHVKVVKPPQDEEKSQYICSQCGKEFKNKYSLDKHEVRHTDLQVTCQICNKVYKNKFSLKDHVCLNTSPRPSRKVDTAGEFICDECGRMYRTKQLLKKHIRNYHNSTGANKFPCLLCPKVFRNKYRWKLHQVTHTKEKNFSCDICGDEFVAKNSLVYHRRIHTGEKPYECGSCDMRFLSASRRADHVRRHHIAAMATCPLCGITIKQTGMSKHRKRHVIFGSKEGKSSVSEKGKEKVSI